MWLCQDICGLWHPEVVDYMVRIMASEKNLDSIAREGGFLYSLLDHSHAEVEVDIRWRRRLLAVGSWQALGWQADERSNRDHGYFQHDFQRPVPRNGLTIQNTRCTRSLAVGRCIIKPWKSTREAPFGENSGSTSPPLSSNLSAQGSPK